MPTIVVLMTQISTHIVIEVPPPAPPKPLWYEEALAEWKATHNGRAPGDVTPADIEIRPRWRHLEQKLREGRLEIRPEPTWRERLRAWWNKEGL